MFEIISMLVSGKAESTEPLRIDRSFLEFCPQSQVEACPSPRVLDSHLPFRLLPIQLKGNKTIMYVFETGFIFPLRLRNVINR